MDDRHELRTAFLLLQDWLTAYDEREEIMPPAGARDPVDLLRSELRWLRQQLGKSDL